MTTEWLAPVTRQLEVGEVARDLAFHGCPPRLPPDPGTLHPQGFCLPPPGWMYLLHSPLLLAY